MQAPQENLSNTLQYEYPQKSDQNLPTQTLQATAQGVSCTNGKNCHSYGCKVCDSSSYFAGPRILDHHTEETQISDRDNKLRVHRSGDSSRAALSIASLLSISILCSFFDSVADNIGISLHNSSSGMFSLRSGEAEVVELLQGVCL